jgi:hypothetical protein
MTTTQQTRIKPNSAQIKAIKQLIKAGKIPRDSKIVTKQHEIYCYLPPIGKESKIIAVHTSGLITNHIHVKA